MFRNNPRLRLKFPASWSHGSSTCTRNFMSYCAKNLSRSWSTVSDLKQQSVTRTSSCLGILTVSVNVLSIQRSAECVLWIRCRHIYLVKLSWLFWLYSCTFDLPQFPRQSLILKFMTTLLTTLLNGFWRFVRRFIRINNPLHVTQKHQQPIIPIKNTIIMMLHNTLTHKMMFCGNYSARQWGRCLGNGAWELYLVD